MYQFVEVLKDVEAIYGYSEFNAGLQPVLRKVEQAFLTAFVLDYSRADMSHAGVRLKLLH